MLLIANFGFSQNNARLLGPAAKNAKPWHKKSNKSKVVFIKNKEFLKGPAAKNAKLWQKEDSSQVYIEVKRANWLDLKGPLAKNFKPWMLTFFNAMDTITVEKRDSSKIRKTTE